jgi:hypothetical protein
MASTPASGEGETPKEVKEQDPVQKAEALKNEANEHFAGLQCHQYLNASQNLQNVT